MRSQCGSTETGGALTTAHHPFLVHSSSEPLVQPEFDQSSHFRWWPLPVFLLCAFLYVVAQNFISPDSSKPADLQLTDKGGQLLIEWVWPDASSANGKHATLFIQDGVLLRSFDVAGNSGKRGSMTYVYTSDDVLVRLAVQTGKSESVVGSGRLIGSAVPRFEKNPELDILPKRAAVTSFRRRPVKAASASRKRQSGSLRSAALSRIAIRQRSSRYASRTGTGQLRIVGYPVRRGNSVRETVRPLHGRLTQNSKNIAKVKRQEFTRLDRMRGVQTGKRLGRSPAEMVSGRNPQMPLATERIKSPAFPITRETSLTPNRSLVNNQTGEVAY